MMECVSSLLYQQHRDLIGDWVNKVVKYFCFLWLSWLYSLLINDGIYFLSTTQGPWMLYFDQLINGTKQMFWSFIDESCIILILQKILLSFWSLIDMKMLQISPQMSIYCQETNIDEDMALIFLIWH